jgi:hypothetical protein
MEEKPSNAVNLVKMIGGYAVALGCMALVALNTKLGIGLSGEMQMVLIGVAVGGGALGSHGALKTPTDGGQP